MMHYEISGFKFFEVYDNKEDALKRFEEVKNGFTYCEVKLVKETDGYYRSESIKIYGK